VVQHGGGEMHGKELSSATFADGSETPADFVRRCGEIIEQESIQFRWEKGGVLILSRTSPRSTADARRCRRGVSSLPPASEIIITTLDMMMVNCH
jgi:hypothetical protein